GTEAFHRARPLRVSLGVGSGDHAIEASGVWRLTTGSRPMYFAGAARSAVPRWWNSPPSIDSTISCRIIKHPVQTTHMLLPLQRRGGGLQRASKQETSLCPAVKCFLEAAGFRVRREVHGCDAVAVQDGQPLWLAIVEMKLGFNLDLL